MDWMELEIRARTWAGEADGGGGGWLGGDDDEAVLLRLGRRREEVLQRPLQRVEAVVAVVDPDHHRHLSRRRRFRPRRRRRRCCFLRHGASYLWLTGSSAVLLAPRLDGSLSQGELDSSLSWVPSLYSTHNALDPRGDLYASLLIPRNGSV
jgi:hypothetical protein